jgi:hypothetical protein
MHGKHEMNAERWSEKLRGREHFGDLAADGRIILK